MERIEREIMRRRNDKKKATLIKFGVIVAFFAVCSIVNVLKVEDESSRGRSLAASTNETCPLRLQREYDCKESDCADKVSGMINYLHFSFCDVKSDFIWILYIVWLLYLLYLLAYVILSDSTLTSTLT